MVILRIFSYGFSSYLNNYKKEAEKWFKEIINNLKDEETLNLTKK